MKKLNDPVRKVNAQSVGFDVHKNLTVFCVLDAEGNTCHEGRFASTQVEFDKFIKEALLAGPTHFTFEASRSSLWVFNVIRAHVDDEFIHVAQAKRIQAIANSKDKNDSKDAWWLSYLTYEGRLPESHVPAAHFLELRIATRERSSAVKQRTKVINRLKSHFAQIGAVVPSSTIRTKEARLFMAEKSVETEGIRGLALRSCLVELEFFDTQIHDWEKLIATLGAELPDIALLTEEIPGVGKIIAATIIAEAGDIRRFHSAKAFGCATGLTPSDRSTSGKTIHGGITREGNPHLRNAMTQAATACLRSKSYPGLAVGDWIRFRQKRTGIKAKGRAAGARKLAESIWRLFQYGECFDMAKSFGGTRPLKS